MDLNELRSFCNDESLFHAQYFASALRFGADANELGYACQNFVQALTKEAGAHILQRSMDKAEKCYTSALNALATVASRRPDLISILSKEEANIWSQRSFVRHQQGKYYDAIKDAEKSIETDPWFLNGYWHASLALKALSDYPKAAYFLIRALSNSVPIAGFVTIIPELAILISKIRSNEEFKIYRHLTIMTTSDVVVWTTIVTFLYDRNEFESLAILTTGVCDTCHLSETIVHKAANVPGLSFNSLNVGRMLKFLADKEGTKAWHLKLAEFVVKRGANIQTVQEIFKEPLLIVMTTLSLDGELPSFLLLAWDKLPPMDYDQKDSHGNSAAHIVTKHVKSSKRISEIICRDLLDHGCLATDRDGAGKYPYEYIPQQHILCKRLKEAVETHDINVEKRLKLIRDCGNTAWKNNKYDEAIEIYNKALEIVSKFSTLNNEAAVLHSNISAVHQKREAYSEALTSAENSLKADPNFLKGYLRKGLALSKTGRHDSACKAYVSGFYHARRADLMTDFAFEAANFAFEAAKIVCHITVDESFFQELKTVFSCAWPKILEYLTQNGMWAQVKILILGPPCEDYGKIDGPARAGIMAKFDASKAVLSTIFQVLDKKELLAPAIIKMLLLQGASPASLSNPEKETHFHAAVRFCIITRATNILEVILKNDTIKSIQSCRDPENRTPLHTLCIEFEKGKKDTQSFVDLATMLAEKKVDINAKDKYERKAADYLLNFTQLKQQMESIFASPSKRTGAQTFAHKETSGTWSALKDKGNAAYKNGDYKLALQFYSEAIVQLEAKVKPPHHVLSDEDGHNLSILYGNRAECWQKLGDQQMFLNEAKKSVDADGIWYKGHWRVGKAYKGQGKLKTAIKAFVNALNALKISDGDELRCNVLSDLVEAVFEQKDGQEAYLATLRDVSTNLWPNLAYKFIKDLKWELAEFIFRISFTPPRLNCYNEDLKPFCNKNKLDNQRWVCTLILWFLASGSDHRTLKFHEGDTYFHATISIILLSGCNPLKGIKPVDSEATQLLNFVVVNKVNPNREINIRDNKGNTVLHFLATSKGPDQMREFLVNYLVDNGVDVTAVNNERKQAIELVSPSDIIRNTLQFYVNKIKSINKLKEQSKQTTSAAQSSHQERPQPQPAKSANKLKEQTKQSTSGAQNNHQERPQPQPKAAPKTTQQCDACCRRMEKASKWQKSNSQEVFINLVHVVNCKNSSASYHKSMTDQAIQSIAENLAQVGQDIPSSICKLSAKCFTRVLTLVVAARRWALLEMLVTKFREDKGLHSLPDFAKNMSLIDIVKDQSLINQENFRLKLINLLHGGGATLDMNTSASALEAAMKNSEWQVALKLLELRADPRGVTLAVGDTPYHAALQVALNRKPGYFLLLEMLKWLHDNEKATHGFLDVSCQDSMGNTLLHIAAQAKSSQPSLRAVELLCQWSVPADIKNGDGKLAIQYLPNDRDRRAQYLKSSGGASSTSSKTAATKASTSAGSDTSKEHGGARKSAVGQSWSSPQVQRSEMEKRLLALPDAKFNFLTYVKEVDESNALEEDSEDDDSDEEENAPEGDSDSVIETPDDYEYEHQTTDIDIDVKVFDNLEWDVECTEDVWGILRSRKEKVKGGRGEQEEKKQRKPIISYELKQLVVKKIQQLASGNWGPHLQKRIEDTPETLQLFRIPLPNGACILWELALAFSPRLSESAETVLSEHPEKTAKSTAVRGSRIYSELIRVWSIVLKHSDLKNVVQKICDSHQRGKKCIIQKNLGALKSQLCNPTSSARIPVLYVELDQLDTTEMLHQRCLFPPASAHKNEFHVLKFYSFSSSLVSAVLSNSETNVDFPFRVTDIEHAVIKLHSISPLLLLGRSGTGKTTCCLYRLWSMFLHYWEQAIHSDTPLLPRRNYPLEIQDNEMENPEVQENKESKMATNIIAANAPNQDTNVVDSSEVDDQKENVDSESESESSEDGGIHCDHLHQLFVTKNPVLCSEVQKNFTKLCNGSDVAQGHNQNTALPNTLQDVNEFSFPLFLTSRQLLLMLDASVDGEPFFPRDEDLALKVTIPGWGTQDDIFSIIPLEQDDLFDSSDEDGTEKNASQARRVKRVHNLEARPDQKDHDRRECTYEVFSCDVWPRIIKKAEIECHPTLVWTEIMSFIKGSYESLQSEKGYLDKEQYITLGRKRAPNFTGNRSQVYDIFWKYHLFKQKYALFDEADLVYKLYCRLRTMTFQPWVLHEIYVDETQDFTQAELALLVSLCSEPNKMFLTGDTAQSIMRGISFRFHDLRSLFFSVKNAADKTNQHLMDIEVPQKVHQLTHNYRSHTGILHLASSVLDILLDLFPESFDPLEKDQGMFAGPKPIIIELSSPGDLALLLTGSRRKTSHIEFGAHQAVLVVNEAAKAKLPEELGSGIVLTIFESKGLEFDDILIYNFFKDSQARKEWRVVSSCLKKFLETNTTHDNTDNLVEFDADALAQSSKTRPLTFDPNQHKILNSELKHLYTAITRARVNVWIFDEDDEKRAPMFEYFKTLGLVKCMGTEECENVNEAIMFADKSTPKEWRLSGDRYMHQRLYNLAAKCYRIAEHPNKEKVALAYQAALEASRMKTTPKIMRDKYFKAGTQFVDCGDLHRAALCFQNAQEFLLAAIAFEKSGKCEEASVQYLRAQKTNDASRCLEQVGMFGRAIRLLVENDLFDRAIDCLHRYDMKIQQLKREGRSIPAVLIENRPSDVHSEANLCYRAAICEYSRGELAKAVAAIQRSKNIDDQFLFLQEKGFWEPAAEILMQKDKTGQAAEYMLRSGNTDKALEFAELDFSVNKTLRAFIHLVAARKFDEDKKEEIKNTTTKALNMYIELQDYNGQAQAKLMLGKHSQDLKQISSALRDFQKVKPKNLTGELECMLVCPDVMQGLSSLKVCQEVVKSVTLAKEILDVLSSPVAGNSDKYQLYLNFYGMELDSGRHQITWYPKQNPICKDFLKSSPTGNEDNFGILDEDSAVHELKIYLMSKVEKRAELAHKWLSENKVTYLPCIRKQEGQSCDTDCKYMHRPYKSTQEEIEALNLLICLVNLDYWMQTVKEILVKNETEKFNQMFAKWEASKWSSVEELIRFVLPAYPSSQRSEPQHTHEIVKTLRNAKAAAQVERYLRYLWNNPGRVGKGISKNVLKERCKTANWIVQACFFSSLLKLELDVAMEVENLEEKLMSTKEKWIYKSKRHKYALFITFSEKDNSILVETIGTRFVQAHNFLTEDPLEALFPFTKMISGLGTRQNTSLMPKLDHLIFWIEFYVSLTWLLQAKANHQVDIKQCFYMTNSYLFNLNITSECAGNRHEQPMNIQQRVVQYVLEWKKCRSIMKRQGFIANFFVGHNEYCDFSLINEVNRLCQEEPPCFWLAERIIILSALLLLNIPGKFVSDIYETPIRRELAKLTETESMPHRLASLIKELKGASNYHDVAAAVLNYFQQRDCDKLVLCQWLEQKNRPMQLFDAQLEGSPSMAFFVVNIQEEIEKTLKRSETASSNDIGGHAKVGKSTEEMDDVDVQRKETQKAEIYEEKRKKEAAKKIIIALRLHVMKRRLRMKTYSTFEMDEMFKPFQIKDTFCGICGTDLEQPETERSEDRRDQQSKDMHCNDRSHIEQHKHFDEFRRLYEFEIHGQVQKIEQFLCAKKVVENSPIYKDIELETSKILKALHDFKSALADLLRTRKWLNGELLQDHFKALLLCFDQNRRPLESVYVKHKQQMQTSQTHNNKTTELGEPTVSVDFPDQSFQNVESRRRANKYPNYRSKRYETPPRFRKRSDKR